MTPPRSPVGGPARRKPEPLALRVYWSKPEGALMYYHYVSASDGGLLAYFFENIKWPDGKTLALELDARGYDLKTLRLQIRRKAKEPA